MEVTLDNVEDILPAANLLQVTSIVKECKKQMEEKVSEENCFMLLQLANKFNIQGIGDGINRFIRRNFEAVSQAEAFNEISKEDLVKWLSSNALKIKDNELVVYNAAKKWILANEVPSEDVVEIMSLVRFGFIPPQILHSEIATEDIIDDNRECRKMVSEAILYHTNVYSQPFYDGPLNKPRGCQGVMFIENGQRGVGYNTTSLKVNIHHLFLMGTLSPKRPRSSLDLQIVHSSLKSVQVNNFVYLFGTNCQGYQNFAKRYDPSTDTWIELAAVPTHATVGSVVVRFEKQIFFMGGMAVVKSTRFSINPKVITDSACVYDILENKWSLSKELPQKLVYSAITNNEGKIFLSGGYNDQSETMKKTWAYNAAGKVWSALADMNYHRCKHVLESLDDKLYAIGGEVVGDSLRASIEAYDTIADQWTVVLRGAFQSNFATSFVDRSKIYLVGGSEFDDEVHFYDVENNKVAKRPGRIPSAYGCNASACVIAATK